MPGLSGPRALFKAKPGRGDLDPAPARYLTNEVDAPPTMGYS